MCVTLELKISLKLLGYIFNNSKKMHSFSGILDAFDNKSFFMPKIIRILSKDHIPLIYLVHFLPEIIKTSGGHRLIFLI